MSELTIPALKPGEVLVQTKASTICGSDIRCIYRQHLGKGAEGYQSGIIAGHEPAGVIVDVHADGTKSFNRGDRVLVYHVSGCGVCNDCRRGQMNSCTSSKRKAYGWQRNGGMAGYIAAEEKDLIKLPDELTFVDGAIVACSMGTTYEALCKIGISGRDRVLVVGLGPVGLSAAMLARAMGASTVVGADTDETRTLLAGKWCVPRLIATGSDDNTNLKSLLNLAPGGFEKVIDCSGSSSGRSLGLRACRKFGSMVLVGEGGLVQFDASNDLIHDAKTLVGSWVSSTWRMEELVENLVRWNLHPEDLVTHRFSLAQADEAYRVMAEGHCGKVAVVFD